MHCELCGMELTMADNYRITGYVNRPNGIPRNIYVHQDDGCNRGGETGVLLFTDGDHSDTMTDADWTCQEQSERVR